MHIAINKIHPKRYTIHNPYRDWKSLAGECEKLEKALYLAADNHTPTGKSETERRACDIEALTGEQSLLSWIRRECVPALKEAKSWEAFHRELAKAGLAIRIQNNGVNFVAASGECVKGSGIDRSFSKGALEKRFGPFQARPGQLDGVRPEKTYRRDQVAASPEVKSKFAQARDKHDAARKDRIAAIRAEQDAKRAALLAEIRRDRLQARRTPANRLAKKRLYSAIRQKHRAKMALLRNETTQRRRAVYRESPRYTWTSWLQEQAKNGDRKALDTLRERAFGLAWKNGNALRGENDAPPGERSVFENHRIDGVTKKGTIIYSVGKDVLRDDGESFRINRDAGLDSAILALRIARKRFGSCLFISGDRQYRDLMLKAAVEGKVGIAFSDPALEMKRKAMMQRHTQNQARQQRQRI
jgi:hypothetical protein